MNHYFFIFSILISTISADPITATQSLISRVIGSQYVSSFNLTVISGQSNGNDVFEVGQTSSVPIPLRGNNAVALSSAFNWYLKYYCNNSVSWGWNGTGNYIHLPNPLPTVPTTVRMESPVKWRYYMNVCTVSYSMAWWDWARWEQEIDWMAMNGYNLPLSFTGQEFIWAKVYTDMGLTEADLEAEFPGGAFLAWERMGNMRGWGGPMTNDWREAQANLQKQILARQRELGMTSVLPAFSGHIPQAIARLYPNASIARSSDWGGFSDQYCCNYLLSPTDPLFPVIAKSFVQAQTAEFGTDHIYNCDTFNEMDPASSDPTYLADCAAAVYKGMAAADPSAIWLMQGWLFHSSFWTQANIKAYLSGVPNADMIILDLNSEASPLWTTFMNNGKDWIWCMLHNYGGRRSLYGDLNKISTQPIKDIPASQNTGVGTGITMEAIEQNYIMYELMSEMGWRKANFDISDWVQRYAVRRYGASSGSISRAWSLLQQYIYTSNSNYISLIEIAPSINMGYSQFCNASALVEAWKLFITSSSETPQTNPWKYDLVDITRQTLANMFQDTYALFQSAWNRCYILLNTFTVYKNTDAPGNDIERVGNCGANFSQPCDPNVLTQYCLNTTGCAAFNINGYLKRSGSNRVTSNGCDLYVRDANFTSSLCSQSIGSIQAYILKTISDIDKILGTDVNYLLGVWIEMARSWGVTAEEKDNLELNARNQVTLWGPDGNINDYAAKQWQGLVGDYYYTRWELFMGTILSSIATGIVPDWNAYSNSLLNLGRSWYQAKTQYPTQTVGDTLKVSQELFTIYAPDSTQVASNYNKFVNSDNNDTTAILYTTWSKDIGQISYLCTIEPLCMGFNTKGNLFISILKQTSITTTDLYIKKNFVSPLSKEDLLKVKPYEAPVLDDFTLESTRATGVLDYLAHQLQE